MPSSSAALEERFSAYQYHGMQNYRNKMIFLKVLWEDAYYFYDEEVEVQTN